MVRIFITGCAGSGKSTLAQKLGLRLHAPVFELDDLLFVRKCTVTRPKEERKQLLHELLSAYDAWIIEGSSTSWTREAVAQADIIVSLEAPRPVLLFRVAKRHIRRRIRKDAPEETFTGFFELCTGIWQYKNPTYGQVQNVEGLLAVAKGERVVLRSSKDVDAFLARFPQTRAAPIR